MRDKCRLTGVVGDGTLAGVMDGGKPLASSGDQRAKRWWGRKKDGGKWKNCRKENRRVVKGGENVKRKHKCTLNNKEGIKIVKETKEVFGVGHV